VRIRLFMADNISVLSNFLNVGDFLVQFVF
jgi:hypothetical protein